MTDPQETHVDLFLASDERLSFAEVSDPELTVLMIVYRQPSKTLQALRALLASQFQNYALVLVDNASGDRTAEILERIDGARILRNGENLHFLRANNQAIPHIRGEYLLFLNNDAAVRPDALGQALNLLRGRPDCGAVGAKLVYPDGTLQEAGSILWREAACLGYGRGEPPDDPRFAFQREVDFCSGAFLMTRSRLFVENGGFDERFAPAYYEEVDFCVGLQRRGFSVIYDPRVVVVHHEYGGASREQAVGLMTRNQALFREKHRDWLEGQLEEDARSIPEARFSRKARAARRMLYVDEQIPHRDIGAGYPRGNQIVNQCAALGWRVSVYGLNTPAQDEAFEALYRDIDPGVECLSFRDLDSFEARIREMGAFFDVVWVSRPNVFNRVWPALSTVRNSCRVLYDAEAVFSLREAGKNELFGSESSPERAGAELEAEMAQARQADGVVTVTEAEARLFREHGCAKVAVLGHAQTVRRETPGFASRKDLLFVGNLDYDDTPNTDSVCWFVRGVFPLLSRKIPGLKLHLVGPSQSRRVRALEGPDVIRHGKVADLHPLYDASRLLIAPTRYAAGIPLKVVEAAAAGLPAVATDLLRGQLEWRHGEEIWSAPARAVDFARAVLCAYQEAETWECVQRNARKRVEADFSGEGFRRALGEIAGQGRTSQG